MTTTYFTHALYRHARDKATLTLLSALLAGCTLLGPDYVKPEPNIPGQWSRSTGSNNIEISHQAQDLSTWWAQLDDPLLAELISSALQSNLDLRAAQARLQESRARRNLASGNRFPTLNGGLSGSRNRASGNTAQLFDAGFDASWEPDVFGGQRRALEGANADLEARQADLQATQVSLSAELALNYIEVRNAQARLRIARNNLATQAETLQITDWRAQAGLATVLDVDQARTNLEQTRATIPNLETTLAQAEHRIAILLGETPAALHDQLATPVALPALPDQVATGIPADALRQRPDVRAAERRLAAETARIGSAMADRYPSFNLTGSFGWKAATLGGLGGPGTVVSSLAASMLGTLFDGGRLSSRIAVQNAVQQQALVAYEQSVLTALEDVENALAAYKFQRERQQTLRTAAAASRSAAKLARQLYESGNADFQKVLDAQRSLLAIEDSLAASEAQGLSALVQLYKAMGGGWQPLTESTEESTS